MPSGGRLRGVLPMEDDDGASSTMAHALALTEDSDFGEMEEVEVALRPPPPEAVVAVT